MVMNILGISRSDFYWPSVNTVFGDGLLAFKNLALARITVIIMQGLLKITKQLCILLPDSRDPRFRQSVGVRHSGGITACCCTQDLPSTTVALSRYCVRVCLVCITVNCLLLFSIVTYRLRLTVFWISPRRARYYLVIFKLVLTAV